MTPSPPTGPKEPARLLRAGLRFLISMADNTTQRLKIEQIAQDPLNANRGTERGHQQLSDSLRKFGAGRSILLDRDNRTIAGNKTLETAAALGFEEVLVVETDGKTLVAVKRTDVDLDSKEGRELAIADNRVGEVNLEWNSQVLQSFIDEGVSLGDWFFEEELSALFAAEIEATTDAGLLPDADPDAIPESAPARCQPGDIWTLGRHRLMCGDSTVANDVERLMNGQTLNLCFTSPPYDQQRKYDDANFDWNDLMQGVFANVPFNDNMQILVNLGLVHRDGEWIPYWDGWIEWMRSVGWRRFGFYVWDQGAGLPGDWCGRLAPSHEFVFHFNHASRKPNKTVETKPESRVQRKHKQALRHADGTVHTASSPDKYGGTHKIPDSVIRINREAARGLHTQVHPAVFPVALPGFVIKAWCSDHGVVYDPFLGSGTTLIAAEIEGRNCYGMEISPKYCDPSLTRWEQATGKTAERMTEGSLA